MNEKGRKTFALGKEYLVKNLILIDGLSRAGKFFLGKIVSSLKNIEYFLYLSLLEHIPYIHRLGGITEDAAISLLRTNIDEQSYNMKVGRYLNQRHEDATSVYNSHEFEKYLQRSLNTFENKDLIDAFQNGGRYSLFVTHETYSNINLFFKAYPELKVINLIRHPIDIAHSWLLRGWGDRFMTDPLSFVPMIQGRNNPIPWYAASWIEEYESYNEMDRIIKSIASLLDFEKKTCLSISENIKKQILRIRYEDVVEKTHDSISKMCAFLHTEPSEKISQILAREKCPKKIPSEARENKKKDILSKATKPFANLLQEISYEYDDLTL